MLTAACIVGLGLGLSAGQVADAPAPTGEYLVYVGTYTGGGSEGIYVFRFDPSSNRAAAPDLAARTESPSFLALHPGGRFLYAVNELGAGTVSAFAIDPSTGKLEFLGKERSEGSAPCHLVVDSGGKNVLVANYGDGRVAVLPIAADGRLKPASCTIAHRGGSVDRSRQEGPHAHCVSLDAGDRFAVVADLGMDRLVVYRYRPEDGRLAVAGEADEAGRTGVAVAAGSGPRHFTFHPNGRFAYSIAEMACTVTAFRWDGEKGGLREIGNVSTLPGKREKGTSTAEIEVHPSGKFLYGSNRGHDSIAAFRIDPEKGTLAPIGHFPSGGKVPRSFAVVPGGRRLLAANQDSGTIAVFSIDADTGRLEATGEVVRVPKPVCLKFLARAKGE